LTIFKVH